MIDKYMKSCNSNFDEYDHFHRNFHNPLLISTKFTIFTIGKQVSNAKDSIKHQLNQQINKNFFWKFSQTLRMQKFGLSNLMEMLRV